MASFSKHKVLQTLPKKCCMCEGLFFFFFYFLKKCLFILIGKLYIFVLLSFKCQFSVSLLSEAFLLRAQRQKQNKCPRFFFFSWAQCTDEWQMKRNNRHEGTLMEEMWRYCSTRVWRRDFNHMFQSLGPSLPYVPSDWRILTDSSWIFI